MLYQNTGNCQTMTSARTSLSCSALTSMRKSGYSSLRMENSASGKALRSSSRMILLATESLRSVWPETINMFIMLFFPHPGGARTWVHISCFYSESVAKLGIYGVMAKIFVMFLTDSLDKCHSAVLCLSSVRGVWRGSGPVRVGKRKCRFRPVKTALSHSRNGTLA